jgi:hypothetical protein
MRAILSDMGLLLAVDMGVAILRNFSQVSQVSQDFSGTIYGCSNLAF